MRFWSSLVFAILFITATSSFTQTDNVKIAPIVLFVHGWCGDADSWNGVQNSVEQFLFEKYPKLYPDPTSNPKTYATYYQPSANKVWFQEIAPVPGLRNDSADPDARFFRIAFYPENDNVADYRYFLRQDVAERSIAVKAIELGKVIASIREQTNIRPIILITHSMGSLVARALLENFENVYEAPARGNTLLLLEVDTPNVAVSYTKIVDKLLEALPDFGPCVKNNGINTVNFDELSGGIDQTLLIKSIACLGPAEFQFTRW